MRSVGARPFGSTLLVVDDDQAFATMLCDALSPRGYVVHVAAAGRAAVELAHAVNADLVIVDVLADRQGLLVCADLHKRLSVPIIIISGTQWQHAAALGFELGAFDFVAKPVSVDDLDERLQRALRTAREEQHARPATDLVVGPLAIDTRRRLTTVGDHRVALTRTEYRLLCTLVTCANRVVSVADLAAAHWGYYDVALDLSVRVHLRRIRAKLRALPAPCPRIETVRGLGYRLCWAPDPAA
jgi:DNA-binding response OmpR family regulator